MRDRRRRRWESAPVEIQSRPGDVGSVGVDPEDHAFQEAVEAQSRQASAEADHAGQALHVGVAYRAVAEESFVRGHFGDGCDQLIRGPSGFVSQCAVDFADGHASELE